MTIDPNKKDIMGKMMLTMLAMFAEMERDVTSQRTIEALASRKGKGILGHKKGTLLNSVYDKDHTKILDLLNMGVSFKKIIELHLDYGTVRALKEWTKKRTVNGLIDDYNFNEDYKRFLLK